MYRVEIFDMYERAFVSFFMLDKSVTIYEDYLSPRKFDITAPADQECEVKNTIRIADGKTTVYSGFIDNIKRDKTQTVITVAPLILLLNEQSVQNTTGTDFALQIDWQLYYDFRRTSPTLYPLPFWRWSNSPYSNWGGVTQPYGATLMNDKDCILLRRKTYGKFMTFGLATNRGWLGVPHYGFQKLSGYAIFEADTDNVIAKEIEETSQNGYNILMVWVPRQDAPGNYSWYTCLLLPDGTITTNGDRKDEITEPRITHKVMTEYRTFTSDELYNLAVQSLKPSTDSLTIKLTYKKDDKIGRPLDRPIGNRSKIYANGKLYETYQTGKITNRDTVTLIFGMTRTGLTEQLNEEDS